MLERSKKIKLIIFSFVLQFLFLGACYGSTSSGFDFAVGAPDAKGYYVAQGLFGRNSLFSGYHLGEDWNRGSGDMDAGDYIYSLSEGVIKYSRNAGRAWGRVIIIQHKIKDNCYASLYGHIEPSSVTKSEGETVKRGEIIGRIRNGLRLPSGYMYAHLHLELRNDCSLGVGSGYSKTEKISGYLNPTEFIKFHRPPKAVELNLELQSPNSAKLSWTGAAVEGFQKYEIYRSQEGGGTAQEARRTLLATFNNSNELEFLDKNLKSGSHYYSIAVYFENGLYAFSEEKSLFVPRQILPIETNSAKQERPIIAGSKIFWTDYRSLGTNDRSGFLYYYDLESAKLDKYTLPPGFPKYALEVTANSDFVIFRGQSLPTGDYDVFAYNINTGELLNLVNDTNNASQYYPAISLNNYTVWSDGRSGKFDIYYFDLNNPENGEKVLVAASENERFPKIWGNVVVWADTRRLTRTDLYYKEIPNGEEVKVAENITQIEPDVWKNYIVWAKESNLYLYNISTKETKIIDTAKKVAWPRINDGKIVYLKDGKIALYDLASQMSELIETPNLLPQNPYYAKDMIVFAAIPESDPQSANYDIYLINL